MTPAAVVLACCLWLLIVPGARAAAWLPPEALAGQGADFTAGMASDGTIVTAWLDYAPDFGDGDDVVRAAIRPPGGAFEPSAAISAPGTLAEVWDLAVAPDGAAAAVWMRSGDVEVSVREPGGAFSAPVTLPDGGRTPVDPTVAFASDGTVFVAFRSTETTSSGTVQRVEYSRRPPGGSFSDLATVAETVDLDSDPTNRGILSTLLAPGPSGSMVFVWSERFRTGPAADWFNAIGARRLGSDLGPKETVLEPEQAGFPIALTAQLDGGDDLIIAWRRQDATGEDFLEACALGSCSTPDQVSAAGGTPFGLELTVDGAGDVHAVWSQDGRIWLARRPRGSSTTFDEPIALSDAGVVSVRPALARDAFGTLHVAWAQQTEPQRVRARARSAGASEFGPIVDLSGVVADPLSTQLDFDGAGNGVALWTGAVEPGGPMYAEFAGWDGVAPELRNVSIPGDGLVGDPLAFSVSPFDVWGPVQVTWTLGGSTASGATASHAFGTPGTHPVQAQATDAAGQTTAATGQVVVSSPTPSSPGTDATPPAIADFAITRRRFAVGRSATPISARRVRRGTAFRFSLSEAASVVIGIQRAAPGRRAGGRCRRPSRSLRSAPRCTRWLHRGKLRRSAAAGPGRLAFSGRLGRRALAPGTYRAGISATDAAGNRSAPSSRLHFRVVRG